MPANLRPNALANEQTRCKKCHLEALSGKKTTNHVRLEICHGASPWRESDRKKNPVRDRAKAWMVLTHPELLTAWQSAYPNKKARQGAGQKRYQGVTHAPSLLYRATSGKQPPVAIAVPPANTGERTGSSNRSYRHGFYRAGLGDAIRGVLNKM